MTGAITPHERITRRLALLSIYVDRFLEVDYPTTSEGLERCDLINDVLRSTITVVETILEAAEEAHA